jgi:transposase
MTRVPGIGPTFARAIVDHFGSEQVFAELDRRPERLREVRTKAGRAISRRSVERAIAAWREVATIREVETFLFTHGISAVKGVKTLVERRIRILTPFKVLWCPGPQAHLQDFCAATRRL